MSVVTQVKLPDQPTSGGVYYRPLGGDGLTGPHSEYFGRVSSAGDASGGRNTVTLRFDPQYCQLVLRVSAEASGIAADRDVEMAIYTDGNRQMSVRENLVNRPISGLGVDGVVVWNPPPWVQVAGPGDETTTPWISAAMNNATGEDLAIAFHIFNFDRQALQRVPLEILSRCLVRGETVHS